MTAAQARRILDQLRTGDADYSDVVIRDALIASGDLVDQPPPELIAPPGCVWVSPYEGWIDLRRSRQ